MELTWANKDLPSRAPAPVASGWLQTCLRYHSWNLEALGWDMDSVWFTPQTVAILKGKWGSTIEFGGTLLSDKPVFCLCLFWSVPVSHRLKWGCCETYRHLIISLLIHLLGSAGPHTDHRCQRCPLRLRKTAGTCRNIRESAQVMRGKLTKIRVLSATSPMLSMSLACTDMLVDWKSRVCRSCPQMVVIPRLLLVNVGCMPMFVYIWFVRYQKKHGLWWCITVHMFIFTMKIT